MVSLLVIGKGTSWRLDEISQRLERITQALNNAQVSYALVGGQAVALWVATKDPAAVRTTKDVDILIRRQDLAGARAAAAGAGFDYFEVMNVGMLLERTDPNPRKGVHLVWSGEKIQADYPLPSPTVDERVELEPGKFAISLPGLVRMKLLANRDQDRLHLRDLIEVDLIDRSMLAALPEPLLARLEALLRDAGR